MRIGFVLNTVSAGWLGGLNYFRSLLSALAEHGSGELEPVLVVGHGFPAGALEGFPPVELRRTSGLDRFRPAWLARGTSMVALRHDWPFELTARRLGIDVLSHSVPPGPHGRIPTISWIPDFQHLHLPEFFERRELRFRNRHFRSLADHATLVLLSSQSAVRDLATFRPAAVPKVRVLRFVVEPPAPDALPRPADLRERYELDGPYLHVANQFWAHKNHRVLVEAIGLLRDRGVRLTVAATGDARDYRRPEVFDDLMARAEELGVSRDFRVLGRVPYRDVAGLMRGAQAVVNPSFFEGWNTAVEEAKSLGKTVIASDIPVHREQAPPGARYFDPHDPDALADTIAQVLDGAAGHDERDLEARAAAELPERRRRFARGYEEIVREAFAAR